VGMPFGYPRISIPSPAHYGCGSVQGLDKLDSDEGLWIGGKATMEILGARWHMKYPGSSPRGGGSLRPASNLVYDHNGVYREPSHVEFCI
jgi:hypothetical protein